MAIEIDIKTRIIEQNHTVMIARPGAKYRLHNEFSEQRFVGVELPGLFEGAQDISFEDEQIIARIKRSLEIRRWIQGGNQGPAPDNDLNNYDNVLQTPSIRQYLRIIRYFCSQAKFGDLILNPPSNFNGKVRIGEIPRDAHPGLFLVEFYEGYPIIGIPIRWVGELMKRDLPSNSLEALKKPTALFSVGPDHRDKIYAAAYGNFVYRDRFTSTFATQSERYGALDELVFQAFLNSVALNTRAVNFDGEHMVDLASAAVAIINEGAVALGDYALDLNININSPGLISLISTRISPLVAVAMFTLAVTLGAGAQQVIEEETLVIGNSSAGPDDQCAAEVRRQVYTQMKLMGWDKWPAECERLMRLKAATGLDSRSQLEERPQGRHREQ